MFTILNRQPLYSPLCLPLLIDWLDGKDPAATGIPPSIGDSIGSWQNKIPSADPYIQNSTGARPTFQSGGILFDDIDDFLVRQSLNVTLLGEFTIVAVTGAPSTGGAVMGNSLSLSCKFTASNAVPPAVFFRVIPGGTGQSIMDYPSGTNMFTFTRDSASKVDFRLNNGAPTRLYSDVAQVGTMTLNRIGRDEVNNFWGGLIKEIIISRTNISSAQIASLYNYESFKWSF